MFCSAPCDLVRGMFPVMPCGRLTWDEVKQIDSIAHAARRERQPLNVLVTIRAPRGAPDAASKRKVTTDIAHLGEALKRRGQEHVGLTVFEKSPDLHAHHLVHVRRENIDVVERRHDGEIVDVRKADAGAVAYITKQRQCLSPAFEAEIRRPREKSGGPIPGKRWTATPAAQALVRPQQVVAPVKQIPAPQAPVTIAVSVKPQQLALFTDLPKSRPPFSEGAEVREIRLQLGKTQDWLATQLGSGRSHIANFERGHDRLSPPRRRLLRHIVETERLAA